MGEMILEAIEHAGLIIDALGSAVIVIGIVWGLAMWGYERSRSTDRGAVYQACRQRIGHSILLGLEILVASDIIHTVAVEPTFANVGVLGILIVVRTLLSWTLVLDLESRWPWQPERST